MYKAFYTFYTRSSFLVIQTEISNSTKLSEFRSNVYGITISITLKDEKKLRKRNYGAVEISHDSMKFVFSFLSIKSRFEGIGGRITAGLYSEARKISVRKVLHEASSQNQEDLLQKRGFRTTPSSLWNRYRMSFEWLSSFDPTVPATFWQNRSISRQIGL